MSETNVFDLKITKNNLINMIKEEIDSILDDSEAELSEEQIEKVVDFCIKDKELVNKFIASYIIFQCKDILKIFDSDEEDCHASIVDLIWPMITKHILSINDSGITKFLLEKINDGEEY